MASGRATSKTTCQPIPAQVDGVWAALASGPAASGGPGSGAGMTAPITCSSRLPQDGCPAIVTAIIGYAIYAVTGQGGKPEAPPIAGLVNCRASDPKMLTRNHVSGTVTYPVSPPVGGGHNRSGRTASATCTQRPSQTKTRYTTSNTAQSGSPTDQTCPPTRSAPSPRRSAARRICSCRSSQGWTTRSPCRRGDINSSSTPRQTRVDQFIRDFRFKAAPEPDAPSSNGVTATGTVPHNTPGG